MKFDVWKDIVPQSSHFKYRPDLVTLAGGGKSKISENAWSGRIGTELGGKNKTSPRYVIEITETDPLSLG